MGKNTIMVLLVGLALASVNFAEAQSSTLALSGTLVVTVPSREGLVVAADSRGAVTGTGHCDDQFKIIEPIKAARIAASVVGGAVFLEPPGPDDSDFCKYVKRAHRNLDVIQLTRDYLETETADVSTLRLEKFALQCVAAVQKFHDAFPSTLQPFAGRSLLNVILMGYDPKTRTTVIRDFVVRLSSEPSKAKAGKTRSRTFFSDSKREMFLFGEADYVNKHVIGGIGRQFLSPETIRFIRQQTNVGKTEFGEALSAAINVIDAASKTTALVSSQGIGGPIDVLLLGNEPRPRRVQWKSQ
jgi:hypothetical protein